MLMRQLRSCGRGPNRPISRSKTNFIELILIILKCITHFNYIKKRLYCFFKKRKEKERTGVSINFNMRNYKNMIQIFLKEDTCNFL